MKYVEIVDGTTLRWFRVPDKIANHVHASSNVWYGNNDETQKEAYLDGIVIRAIDGISDIDSSLEDIIGVKAECVMSEIKIPKRFEESRPAVAKLKRRLEELYEDGEFKTKVIVNGDNLLLDGYTAYLVSKMFGMPALEAYCVVTGGEE